MGFDGNPTRSRIPTWPEAKSRETFGDEQMPYVMQEKLGQATWIGRISDFLLLRFPGDFFKMHQGEIFCEKMGLNDPGGGGGGWNWGEDGGSYGTGSWHL